VTRDLGFGCEHIQLVFLPDIVKSAFAMMRKMKKELLYHAKFIINYR